MEVCKEEMRGMPRYCKYEWRHKGEKKKKKKVDGLLSGFRYLYGGLMFDRRAFVPVPGQVYPKRKIDSFSISTRIFFSSWTLFH